MREILFRGKSIQTGNWYCGGILNVDGKIPPYVPMIAVRDGDDDIFTVIDADPDTVGQFTGLTDKNGKKIFEGDIVEPTLTGGTHKGFSWGKQVVVFDRGVFCLKSRREEITPMCNYAAMVQFMVLGNIHDNPELVGE